MPTAVQYYLNDLLSLPLVLAVAVLLQRFLVLRQHDYALTKYQILQVFIYWSVMFEGVIPNFVPRYTADLFDVVVYGLGAWLFYLFGNKGNTNLVKKVS